MSKLANIEIERILKKAEKGKKKKIVAVKEKKKEIQTSRKKERK